MADAVATVDKSGKQWALALVNRDPVRPLACTIKFNDQPLNGKYKAVVLEGDSPEAFNSIENPQRVMPVKREFNVNQGTVELPPHSLTILKVRLP